MTAVSYTHLDVYKRQEYDELTEAVESYKDKFESVSIAEPLLGAVSYTHLDVYKRQAMFLSNAHTEETTKETLGIFEGFLKQE